MHFNPNTRLMVMRFFRIFQPRYYGEAAQAIIDDFEGVGQYLDPRQFGNLTFSRKKRSMTRRQMEQEAQRLYREYKTKRHH
jgi:hypothetical protein